VVQTLTRWGVHVVFVKGQLAFTGEDPPVVYLMRSVTRRARTFQVGCGREDWTQVGSLRFVPPEQITVGQTSDKKSETSTLTRGFF